MSTLIQRQAPPAVAGTYSNFVIVKTRDVVQVVIEVPIERAHQVTDLLGFPRPGGEQWVAVAPIGFNPYSRPGGEPPPRRPQPVSQDADTDGQRAVTACAIRCQEPSFQRWLLGPPPSGGWSEEDAAAEVRRRLGIASRGDLALSNEARRRWKTLLRQYMEATHEPPPR